MRVLRVVTAAAIVAVIATACAQQRDAAPDLPVGASTTPPSSPATSPPPSSAPPSASGPDTAASPDTCVAAELAISVRDGDAAAGTVHRDLVFTNRGGSTCVIHGYPGVSYVAGDDGHQVGPAAFRDGVKGAPVTLGPGAAAAAPVGFVNVRNYDPAVCKPTEVRGLRVYPPHDTAAVFVALPGTGCAGTPPGNQLTVRTVVPAKA